MGLLVVCLIAESMGQLIETGITELGLPSSLAGVLVAMLILRRKHSTPCRPLPGRCNVRSTPSMARCHRGSHGAGGAGAWVITNTDVILGLEPFEMVPLALTLILSYPHARLTGIEGLMKLYFCSGFCCRWLKSVPSPPGFSAPRP